jgi:phasin
MQSTRIDIPEQMRALAERSVEEAKKAFEQFVEATQNAVAAAEGSAATAAEGAGDIGREALAHAEQNMAASFDFARRLVQARTVEEIAALQQEFVQRQTEAVAKQSRELGEMIGRGAAAAAKKAKI